MPGAIHEVLGGWESFYVIIGTSAAALMGMMFVVITLVADAPPGGASAQGIATFLTPTIVHFSAVLLVSGILSVPWHDFGAAGWALVAGSGIGLFYALVVVRRTFHVQGYKPVLEDWIGYVIVPTLAYVATLVAGLRLEVHPAQSLFVVGATTVVLMFVGIHNAWDTVTHVALQKIEHDRKKKGGSEH